MPHKEARKCHTGRVLVRFKPNISHLRVFGSLAYRHVPDQLRKKLDDKGEQMILVGYCGTLFCRLHIDGIPLIKTTNFDDDN